MPKALIFSDSFMIAMKPYFAETFHRLVIVPHKGLTFDPALIEKEKPDIVIYELVERLIRNEIQDDRTVLNRISQPVLDEIVGSAGTRMKNIRFGDGFVLLGARVLDSKKGKTVQLVWKSLKKQSLSYSNAIHLVNKEGKTLSYFDYLQNNGQTVVNPGDTWLDEVHIPGSYMKDISTIGIGIYSRKDGESVLLPIDRGPRDLGGKRLLIPLPLKPEPPTP